MTVRTWRQGLALMASADAELDPDALEAAVGAALRRWPEIAPVPGILLVSDDLAAAREVAGSRPTLAGDVRQVAGLPHGWAITWLAEAILDTAET